MGFPLWPWSMGLPIPASLVRWLKGGLVPSRPLRVCLDPGHGGHDPGAVVGDVRESRVVLGYALEMRHLMEERGWAVHLTRDSDVFVPLGTRAVRSNEAEAEVFLSLHCNASVNEGAWGPWMIHALGSEQGRALADALYSGLEKLDGVVNPRGERKVLSDGTPWVGGRRLTVLQRTLAPAVLVELGFLTSPDERARLLDPAHRVWVCEALVSALAGWADNREELP